MQVTELTYELERARKAQRLRFLSEVREHFKNRRLLAPRRLLCKCLLRYSPGNKYTVPKPEDLEGAVAAFVDASKETESLDIGSTRVHLEWINEGQIYAPLVGDIGIACDLDTLPRTVDMYVDAIERMCEKKASSKSPWLLVWSTMFWRDKHWLGDEVLQRMRRALEALPFERVYFLESLDDGESSFQQNLVIHEIKTQ